MQLVLDTNGLAIKVKSGRFFIYLRRDTKADPDIKAESRSISPEKISSIAVLVDCMISSAAIRLAVRNNIPVFFSGPGGQMEAKLWSPYFVGMASLRRAQALWHEEGEPLKWAADIITLKLERQFHLLKKQEETSEKTNIALPIFDKMPPSSSEKFKEYLFSQEAHAAKAYWQKLAAVVPEEWVFKGRSRQPALDPFNAALNYLYGMLYPVVEGGIFAAGLDPYMGLLHAEEYDRPALTFDLIEPFRPWADELLLDLLRSGRMDIRHFEPKGEGWWLGKNAKAIVIPTFNDWLLSEKVVGDEARTVRNHIYQLTAKLASDIKKWSENRKK